ncbi:hypothetical protein [Paraliobacillus sp. PM-2]|uniref:hypothetical protein n=1 Tax=Paraliobacillus sp. PM-2 TaxID=1462524 RepID=UPI0011471CE3|nr:hypothetical protein [Paraliobacillus sp. PM-2]
MNNRREGKTNGYRKRSLRFILLGLVTAILLFMGGYFLLNQDQNKQEVIEHILNDQFSAADAELIRLLESSENATIIGGSELVAFQEETELENYFEQKYRSYFTEDMYEKYITTYFFTYRVPAYYSDIQLKVDDISFKKSNDSDNLYHFTVYVSYGDKQKAEVTGRARVNDNNKISYFNILQDNDLSKAISGFNR